jgi:uncharacterized protein YjiS (DUF1127 family)
MPIELAERSSPSMGRSTGIFSETLPFFATPFRAILVWSRRSAERSDLRELARQPRLLCDIGLSREQLLREADKPFWRR